MSEDEDFWLDVLAGLNPAHTPPDLFRKATTQALDHFGGADLIVSETGTPGPPSEVALTQDERYRLRQFMAASTALDFMEQLALGLPKQTSLRLSMVFLRVGIAELAGQRVTISDILREDQLGHAPAPGWPEGKRAPTLTEKTVRNSYINLQSAGLLTTKPGQDAEGRNQYLVLTEEGKRVFAKIVGAVR